ncbi:MAG: ZIP family metal transporter [Clostridiales bacterium]|nr:ZIP family metal transporter [Clostridiales bacterium]
MGITAIIWPLICTVLAGATMAIGGYLAVSGRKPTEKALSIGMGFSAGMLTYLSFAEIVPESVEHFDKALLGKYSIWISLGIVIVVAFTAAVVDRLLPGHDIHHEHEHQHTMCEASTIYKTGIAAMTAIALHNITEGVAIFLTILGNVNIGLPLVLGVAMHNIPCGIAIAMPIYVATNDRKKAVQLSLKSGMFTPIGAVIAVVALKLVLSEFLLGVIMAAVGGVMFFTAAFELYPTSKKYENKGRYTSFLSTLFGVAFMAIVIAIFG